MEALSEDMQRDARRAARLVYDPQNERRPAAAGRLSGVVFRSPGGDPDCRRLPAQE